MLTAVALLAVVVGAQPREPFRVHVYASPRGEPEIVEAIQRATRALTDAVRDESEWFLYVDHREQAEIVIHVEALMVGDRLREESRTSWMGSVSHTTNFMSSSDSFQLQADTEILGRNELLSGRSETSETRAAEALFGELKAYLARDDSDLERRRLLYRYWAQHPEQITVGRALCDAIANGTDDRGLRVLSAYWSGSTLVVTTSRTTSRFPFTTARLETCLPDPGCRETIAEQVLETLRR